MKPAYALMITFALSTYSQLGAQSGPEQTSDRTSIQCLQPRMNFYVVNKPKKLDLYSRLVIIRARKRAMSRREKFIVLVASSSKAVRDRIEYQLKKKNAVIGSLWFDSHGHYKNGYSSFSLGKEEFSYKTITDTVYTNYLRELAAYCDQNTRVAIGSCYSAATYEMPAHSGKPASRMNGDSLIIGQAQLCPCRLSPAKEV